MFNKFLRKIGRWCYDHSKLPLNSKTEPSRLEARNEINMIDDVVIVIHFAHGGVVIETSMYDQKNDSMEKRLYVIHDENDLGQELAQLITLARLQQR